MASWTACVSSVTTIPRQSHTDGPFYPSFLIMPTISRIPFEAHPFTIGNISGVECPQGEAVFVIRARDGKAFLPVSYIGPSS